MPWISISIPVYNAEEELDGCIASILNQSMDDYEIILVDDGSSDRSLDICKSWANKYPNIIHYIHQENAGSLMARRTCLELSQCEWCYVMDSDDRLINRRALEMLQEAVKENPCDLVFFNATNDKDNLAPMFAFPFKDMDHFIGDEKQRLYELMMLDTSLNPLWNKIFKRSLVDSETDYKQYANVRNGTDVFQSFPIVTSSSYALFMDRVLYFYNDKTNNSIVRHFNTTIYDSQKQLMYWKRKIAQQWDMDRDKFEILYRNNCMRAVIACVMKTRYLENWNYREIYTYLKGISKDAFFKKNYTTANMTKAAKVILMLLRYGNITALCLGLRLYNITLRL